MRALFLDVLRELEAEVRALREEQDEADRPEESSARITLLGQFSLFVDEEFSRQVPLIATADVDALIDASWPVRSAFVRVLNKRGLEYDELSSEVWIPPDSTFLVLWESEVLRCEYLSPLYCLLSKAVKAPEKNRRLILQGIQIFGDELRKLINHHGGDILFFTSER
ncbi:MAG: hypothetical protein KDD69_00210 [Bdellovibrionales bacterium]|nr:hypothetical protein [Bdellovibrionales bacterium]